MNTHGIRNALVCLCALMLTTFAVPGIAAKPGPQKLYSLQFLLPPTTLAGGTNPSYDPTTGQLQPPTEVTAIFKNESPPSVGASNIASIKFGVSGLVIAGTTCQSPRGICTVDAATNTASVSNISPPVQATEQFAVTLNVTSCAAVGDAEIPLSSVVVSTGSQVDNGDVFFVYDKDATFPLLTKLSDGTTKATTGISCGDIDCGETFEVANAFCSSTSGDPECVTTVRGNDTNGGCAAAVDYFVTNNLITTKPDKLHFAWLNPLETAAFAYQVNIPSPTAPYLQLAWLTSDGTPEYIPAPPCKDYTQFAQVTPGTLPPDYLPLRYGRLDQNVKMNSNKIQVTLDLELPLTSLPTPPFPIVIGGERMIVTSVNNNNWDVQRGDGFSDVTPHGAGAQVMSTALPKLIVDYANVPYVLTPDQVDAGYTIGMKAQMCLASPLLDNGDGTWTGWVLDSGDGWMNW